MLGNRKITDSARRRKIRRKDTGEDFTPAELVNRILDELSPESWTDPARVFLDPSCGNGNFLVEVQRRLLEAGHSEENVLSRIYGIDIMHDNVIETCERLGIPYNTKARCAISRNVVCADTLAHRDDLWSLFRKYDSTLKRSQRPGYTRKQRLEKAK